MPENQQKDPKKAKENKPNKGSLGGHVRIEGMIM
jgi:hypothetical protein